MKLTDKAVALSIPAGKSDHIEFDDRVPGFGLRARGKARTWIFQYKLAGHTRRMVIGKATAIKAEKALAVARAHYQAVMHGGDPKNDREQRKADAANTLGPLVERYLAVKKDELRPRSLVEVTRHLLSNAKKLHNLPVGSITQEAVADRLNDIAKESGAVTANRVRSSLSALFTWAMKRGYAVSNPVLGAPKRKEKSRDRVLDDAELKTIWSGLDDDEYGTIIRLLLLTGQRANEIAALRWSEIDFERDLIVLPAERTKNARVHQVPMSVAVRDLLKAREEDRDPKRDLLFGYRNSPFARWSHAKTTLDEKLSGKLTVHWVPHDLRRTVATRMADLGVQPHVIEATLNHVSGFRSGVAGVYNRSLYTAEKAAALALWACHVTAVVEGRRSNVVPLQRTAG
jgi:integrase